MPAILSRSLPLYAFVKLQIANVVVVDDGNYVWDEEGQESSIEVSKIDSNMVTEFSYRKVGGEGGGDNTFNITLFDETAVYAESILVQQTDGENPDPIVQIPMRVEYGWSSGGEPIPGRYMAVEGRVQEYTLNFTGPSVELSIVGVFTSNIQLSECSVNSYEGSIYRGNPSEIVKAISESMGWNYSSDTIADTLDVMESDGSNVPKTYLMNGRSYNDFIKQDLCADARTADNRGNFSFFVLQENGEYTAYFLPKSDSIAGSVQVEIFTESSGADTVPLSYLGGEGAVEYHIYNEYNYYTGEENSEVISFSPSYTFNVSHAVPGDVYSVNPETNEVYYCALRGQSITVSTGEDKVVTLEGNRLLGLSGASYGRLATQAQRLWNAYAGLTVTASLEILGDPNIQPSWHRVIVNVMTKYGVKHHTSGIYQVTSVEESVTNGMYVTSLELRKDGDSIKTFQEISGIDAERTEESVEKKKSKELNLTENDSVTPINSNSDIINYGQKYLGTPYIWGGSSLTNGIDNSHFVYQVLKDTKHYSGDYTYAGGWALLGDEVEVSDIQPGDVLVYGGHVAFYVDNTHILHAKGEGSGVVLTETDPLTYLGGVVAIRRFN